MRPGGADGYTMAPARSPLVAAAGAALGAALQLPHGGRL